MNKQDNFVFSNLTNSGIVKETQQYTVLQTLEDSKKYEIRYNNIEYNKVLIIPSKIDKFNITSVNAKNIYNPNIEKIIIEEGIEYISNFSFANCGNLKEVVFPSTIKTIGTNSFINTPWFNQNQNIYINDILFKASPFFTEPIKDNIKKIYFDAFKETSGPEKLILPFSIEEIYPFAFNNFKNTKDIIFQCNYKEIPNKAFINSEIENINIKTKIDSIKSEAFYKCHNLSIISLPNSLTAIEKDAFCECSSLKQISLPDSLYAIGDDAFSKSSLKSIKIPKDVKEFGEYIFYDCEALETAVIDSVNINEAHSLFSDCFNLSEVILADETTTIPIGCFHECKLLRNISLPDSINKINKSAFAMSGIISINIPSNINNISESCFYGCNNLRNIVFPEKLQTISSEAFKNCKKLKELNLPKKLLQIKSEAFKNCKSLEIVNFPNSLEYIEANAFENCTSLKAVYIPINCYVNSVAFDIKDDLNIIYKGNMENYIDFAKLHSGCVSFNRMVFKEDADKIEKYISQNDIENAEFAIPEVNIKTQTYILNRLNEKIKNTDNLNNKLELINLYDKLKVKCYVGSFVNNKKEDIER